MKLALEKFPPSLADHQTTLIRCLEVMNRAMPFKPVYLLVSHARGDAGSHSDIDLCLVAEGAERQL